MLRTLLQYLLLTNTYLRQMSKRPCAIALTSDDSTILCGDKFGDVYSLPLLGKSCDGSSDPPRAESGYANRLLEKEQIPFKSAASSRTVHTKKNQEALRNQQKQSNQRKEQRAPNFEHQLLLGHVSLLTDLACVSLDGHRSPSGRRREYIITSDRDEHIRISRAIPQAHIIEGYCQEHTEFISKIYIPQSNPHILISGGGDGHLLIWDWLRGKVRQRIDLRDPANRVRDSCRQHAYTAGELTGSGLDDKEQNIAVSGIWSLLSGHIVVTCEG